MKEPMHRAAFDALEGYRPFLFGGIRVVILLSGGYLLTLIINRLIRAIRDYWVRAMTRDAALLQFEVQKRAATISSVIRRSLLTLLWTALIMMSLQELGFKIDALLAGAGISAGIIGVAVGFGAQSVIKDILAGMFLLVENQIRVSDVAVINGVGGSVEEINLRTTVLRSDNGAVHIFPNGSIQTLANLTREFSYYVFDLAINYEQDVDRAMQGLRDIALELQSEPDYASLILAPLEVMGVDRLTTAGVQVKARIKTLPTKQWVVGREMNRRIRARFAAEQIDLTTAPTIIRLEGKEEMKAAIREVLREIGDEAARRQ
jgi:small conductance mechanosensitive channel